MKNNRGSKPMLHLIDEMLDCNICGSNHRCLGEELSAGQLEELHDIVNTHGTYKPGETIFKMEDSFKSLYAIRSGSVKLESILEDGKATVKGFFFPGELIGVEAIGDNKYGDDAIALELTRVCEIPFDRLEVLCGALPKLQHEILTLLGHKIRSRNNAIVNGHHLSSEKRVLLFIQELGLNQFNRHTGDSKHIHLPMSKGDIANYLGLRPESLSRALSKLQSEGIIKNHPKEIELLDIDAISERVG